MSTSYILYALSLFALRVNESFYNYLYKWDKSF